MEAGERLKELTGNVAPPGRASDAPVSPGGSTSPTPVAPVSVQVVEAPAERSPGIGARPRFRSTTPGLVTRPMARPEGVRLIERTLGIGGDDPIVDPVEAVVLQALRRALAVALAVGEAFSGQTGLAELKKANLENRLPADRKTEFSELLAAEALAVLSVFANATAFLLAAHATEETVEIGAVEEVLTDNAQLALHGALWELDQDIAVFATEGPRLVPTVLAFAEQLMEKVKLRAASAPRLEAFTGANYRVEADDFPISGFEAALDVLEAGGEQQDVALLELHQQKLDLVGAILGARGEQAAQHGFPGGDKGTYRSCDQD